VREKDYSGKFIVIEGSDASGKQTQVSRLVEWIRNLGVSKISKEQEEKMLSKMPGNYPNSEYQKTEDSIEKGVWKLSFPTYQQTPGGRVVDAYLQGKLGDRDKIPTETIVDIYAADRKQFKEIIYQYLSKGGIIVADRYREANLIHQLVDFSGKEWKDKLKNVKSIDSDLPDADKVFYLDISVEESINRMSDKEKDIHELDKSYLKKSNENGRKVAEHESWKIIDGERNKDEVEEELKKEITHLLNLSLKQTNPK